MAGFPSYHTQFLYATALYGEQAGMGGFICKGSLSLRVDGELELAGVGGCGRRHLQGARIPTASAIRTFS